MDRFEQEILSFMRSWAPYGGPPPDEEILPEFGMTREQLIDRFHQILAAQNARREQERQQPWLRIPAR
jgi:hypothetical protein